MVRQQLPELKQGLFYLIRPAKGGMREHLQALLSHFGPSYRTYLASPGSNEMEGLLVLSGSSYLRLPLEAEIHPCRDLYSFWLVCRALLSTRPSLLHIHGFKAALIGRPAAGLTGVPA
ncbi:MAG TPA: glycosyltransferase family 4 protein, partial [Firmicutes bacterium]|nr:glycosyltransferase family 4 protein [Bacillota bacterium]